MFCAFSYFSITIHLVIIIKFNIYACFKILMSDTGNQQLYKNVEGIGPVIPIA